MTKLDLIVGATWIGLLVGVLVVQAVMVWARYRWARERARHAVRLSRALGLARHERGTRVHKPALRSRR